MFKRLMIGLVAVGLVALFIAEAANAATIRRRNTVENFHECNEFLPEPNDETRDPCFGATSVTDTLYGYDVEGEKVICEMTGRVICDPVDPEEEICSDAKTEAPLTIDSFSAEATFVAQTATDLTELDPEVGQAICDDQNPEVPTAFSKFWPNVFVAHSIYEGEFTNIPETPTIYELIELCEIQTGTDEYSCETLWDSTSEDLPPKLPCCGETNTLEVIINGQGTVTSDDEKINCGEDCSEEYNGTDGCPQVVLTAVADKGFEFTEWSGCDPDPEHPEKCTVNAKDNPTVTATFVRAMRTLTVTIIRNNAWGMVKIMPPYHWPYDRCFRGTCIREYDRGTTVKLKKIGWDFEGWSGDCTGTDKYCTIIMDEDRSVTATFSDR